MATTPVYACRKCGKAVYVTSLTTGRSDPSAELLKSMMLNLGKATEEQERQWLTPRTWVAPGVLVFVLLGQFAYVMSQGMLTPAGHTTVSAKQVGVALFGPWLLAVELASMLLLAALVTAFHLGRQQKERGE